MIKIGLTGSIGMGKSTVLAMFSDLGAAVWDADGAVHRLYAKGGAGAKAVGSMFPDAILDGAVDRRKLAALVLGDAQALQSLEELIHPLVAADREGFMDAAAHAGALAAVLDIPLLFENGTEKSFDATVVVSAPADVQRARVLARPGMTTEKFEAILKLQTPDAGKRKLADYVIDTGVTIDETRAQVSEIYADILQKISVA
jgi:dephospho-CoA kinase